MKGPWSIETPCLGLRPLNESDADEMMNSFKDNAFVEAVRKELSVPDTKERMIESWTKHGSNAPWAVVLKYCEEVAGICSFCIDEACPDHPSLKAIYIITNDCWNQGYVQEATTAARSYMDQAFSQALKDTPRTKTFHGYSLSGAVTRQYLGVSILELTFTLS